MAAVRTVASVLNDTLRMAAYVAFMFNECDFWDSAPLLCISFVIVIILFIFSLLCSFCFRTFADAYQSKLMFIFIADTRCLFI